MRDSWKPHKKTIYIIGGLCVVSALFIWFNKNEERLPLLSNNDILTASTKDITSQDSDGDGVQDWEEFLWGLNPNKKDSDGNGISDDKELEKNKTTLRGSLVVASTTATSTFTDTFSREFFMAFSALKQSGNLTSSNIDKLSQQSIASLTQGTIQEKYSKSDLLIASSSPDAKTIYKKALEQTGKGLQIKLLGKEVGLLGRAINKPRSEKLITELQRIQKIYLLLAEKTILTATPSAIQNTHLDLANTYYKLGAAVGGLTQIYDDPAISIVYFSEYQKTVEKLPTIVTTIKRYTQ